MGEGVRYCNPYNQSNRSSARTEDKIMLHRGLGACPSIPSILITGSAGLLVKPMENEMKVDSPDCRQDKPVECDNCANETLDLCRYESYGPGYQVDWLCDYCRNVFDKSSTHVKQMIQIAQVLERRLLAASNSN